MAVLLGATDRGPAANALGLLSRNEAPKLTINKLEEIKRMTGGKLVEIMKLCMYGFIALSLLLHSHCDVIKYRTCDHYELM